MSKYKILLMDDDDIIRASIGKLFERKGFDVDLAENGEEAVAFYKKAFEQGTPHNIAILDLTVSGGEGGLETIAKLRQINPNVKAIISTGHTNDKIALNYAEYGFVGSIPKPYSFRRLLQLIEELVENNV